MLEVGRRSGSGGSVFLTSDRVAFVTLFADDLAFTRNVLAVMTAETSVVVVMTQIVRMSLPVRLHLRESCPTINLLRLGNGIADRDLFCLRYALIFGLIERVQLARNRLHGSARRRIRVAEHGHTLLFYEWKRNIQPSRL